MYHCGGPCMTATCRPNTLLYVGADVDVHMLKLMQPWETQAVYFDSMKLNYGAQPGYDLTSKYNEVHEGDTRSAWKKTSAGLRPCPQLRCAGPLTELLQQRMKQERGFAHVRVRANLCIEFSLRSSPEVTRSLKYVIAEGWREVLASLRGRVSTVAMVGAAVLGIRHIGRDSLASVIPDCMSNVTLVATRADADLISEFGPILSQHDQRYPSRDIMAGRRVSDQLADTGGNNDEVSTTSVSRRLRHDDAAHDDQNDGIRPWTSFWSFFGFFSTANADANGNPDETDSDRFGDQDHPVTVFCIKHESRTSERTQGGHNIASPTEQLFTKL